MRNNVGPSLIIRQGTRTGPLEDFMRHLAILLLIASTSAVAAPPESYPSRPIRWIVPVPAGSSGDFVTRIVTQKIGESWEIGRAHV